LPHAGSYHPRSRRKRNYHKTLDPRGNLRENSVTGEECTRMSRCDSKNLSTRGENLHLRTKKTRSSGKAGKGSGNPYTTDLEKRRRISSKIQPQLIMRKESTLDSRYRMEERPGALRVTNQQVIKTAGRGSFSDIGGK